MNASTTFNTLRTLILTGALAALFSTAAQAQTAYHPTDAAAGAVGLTRAEVIADTNLWIKAGVDKYVELAQYNVDNLQYQQALAKYQNLRNSPAYAEEVARVETERGEAPTTRLSRQ